MPPWEFQEIGCVWAYLTTLFDHIYKEISAGLYELVEKHATRDDWAHDLFVELPEDVQPPWWNGVNRLANVENIWEFSRSLAAMGPEFVYRLLHGTPLIQRDMVILNGNDDVVNCFPGLYISEEHMVPLIYPADRHAVQDHEHLWSTLPYIEQPNLGWRRMHLLPETPKQTFEDAIDLKGRDEALWSWGFAIFDDERLTAWKAPLLEYRLAQFPHIPV